VRLDVQQLQEVTVARFPQRIFLDGPEGEAAAEQLLALVQDVGRCRLVINFERVEGLSSAMLGKLITIHKKALPLGGRLALCGIDPKLQQIFDTVKLTVLVGFYATEEEAIQSFRMTNGGR
jgi:anti-sigma B factor antagonist